MLAQFGGVTLAFAFIATIGLSGFVTVFLRDQAGVDIYSGGVWLFELPGLALVYTYFQIPLMVIVFLPALDGIRPQWREATESLGGSTWHVLDSSGRFRGAIELPSRFRIFRVTDDALYGTARDDDGVERIVKLRLHVVAGG